MSTLASAIDEYAGADLDAFPDAALAADLTDLRVAVDRLEAQWLRRLAAFDARRAAAADGALSTAAWLRSACRLAPGAARERVVVARELAELPTTAAELAAGDISYRHAALIATATAELPEADTGPAESILLTAARRMNPATLAKLTTRLRYVLDPDGARRRAQDVYEGRRLFVSPVLDGRFALDGSLDPEGGATVLAALTALGAPTAGDSRSPAQRRADALVALARRHLDGGALPECGGERPHVTVTVDLATLERRAGGSGAELDWAGPISAETARRIACDAGVARVITAGTPEPLDVGRRTRVVSAAMRRALAVRDKGCRFPGCDRPPVWTDAHHRIHWADDGPTSLANLISLCAAHHRCVHEGGWRLAGDPNGVITAIRPDGVEIRPP
ncbi:MAG: DUF222 domain-containing protein [Mycobacteriales bacterium]